MTSHEIIQHLTERCKLQRAHAENVYDCFMQIPEILAAFEEWAKTDIIPPVRVGAYTPQVLMQKHKLTPIGALVTLAGLSIDYEGTEECLLAPHDGICVEGVQGGADASEENALHDLWLVGYEAGVRVTGDVSVGENQMPHGKIMEIRKKDVAEAATALKPAIPRKEAMALAALEMGLVVRAVYDPVRGAFRCDAPDTEKGYGWMIVGFGETPKEALIAGAEKLGLEP